jgi:hypothetical protein
LALTASPLRVEVGHEFGRTDSEDRVSDLAGCRAGFFFVGGFLVLGLFWQMVGVFAAVEYA